jgi:hypothetical protein
VALSRPNRAMPAARLKLRWRGCADQLLQLPAQTRPEELGAAQVAQSARKQRAHSVAAATSGCMLHCISQLTLHNAARTWSVTPRNEAVLVECPLDRVLAAEQR